LTSGARVRCWRRTAAGPLALARAGGALALGQHRLAAADDEPGPAPHGPAVVDGVASPRGHPGPVDDPLLVRIPQPEVGIGADRDGALARVQAEQPGG